MNDAPYGPYGVDWFESAIANPDLVLRDLVHVLHQDEIDQPRISSEFGDSTNRMLISKYNTRTNTHTCIHIYILKDTLRIVADVALWSAMATSTFYSSFVFDSGGVCGEEDD